MNNEYFRQMMAQLQSNSMLPPPTGDYAPGGAMFKPTKYTPEQEAEFDKYQPTSILGKVGKIVAPDVAMKMAGKGGGAA